MSDPTKGMTKAARRVLARMLAGKAEDCELDAFPLDQRILLAAALETHLGDFAAQARRRLNGLEREMGEQQRQMDGLRAQQAALEAKAIQMGQVRQHLEQLAAEGRK